MVTVVRTILEADEQRMKMKMKKGKKRERIHKNLVTFWPKMFSDLHLKWNVRLDQFVLSFTLFQKKKKHRKSEIYLITRAYHYKQRWVRDFCIFFRIQQHFFLFLFLVCIIIVSLHCATLSPPLAFKCITFPIQRSTKKAEKCV